MVHIEILLCNMTPNDPIFLGPSNPLAVPNQSNLHNFDFRAGGNSCHHPMRGHLRMIETQRLNFCNYRLPRNVLPVPSSARLCFCFFSPLSSFLLILWYKQAMSVTPVRAAATDTPISATVGINPTVSSGAFLT